MIIRYCRKFSDLPAKNGLINFPVYEHGNNIRKSHKLAINASKVSYLDFPFIQNTSQKQQIINNIRNNDGMVCVAHPGLLNGHTFDDLKLLSGYRFIEAINPHNLSLDRWDYALQNNHISWILADDDTHDLVEEPAGYLLNLVGVRQISKSSFLKAIYAGTSVAVKTIAGKIDVALESLKTNQNKASIITTGDVIKIRVIENGKVLHEFNSNVATIDLTKTTNYLRFEIVGKESTIYTNPILRTELANGFKFNDVKPTLNYLKTIGYRLLVLLVGGMVLFLLLKFLKRK